MKLYILLISSLICLSNSLEEIKYTNRRLTFKEIFDLENTYYILNTKKEYKEIKNLKKMKYIKI